MSKATQLELEKYDFALVIKENLFVEMVTPSIEDDEIVKENSLIGITIGMLFIDRETERGKKFWEIIELEKEEMFKRVSEDENNEG